MINQQDEQLRAELERLQARYDFLLAAVDNLPNPIFMKDDSARFFFFNKAYSEFFNMKRSDYIGKTVLDLDYLPQEDRERFQSEDLKAIQQLDVISYDAEFTAPDGEDHPTYYWSRGFLDPVNDRHGLVGEIVDLYNERKAGIFNRSILMDKGVDIVGADTDSSESSCVILFDLDNFSKVNDKYGHLKGDGMLAQFAGILRAESRATDLPVRYGGDEFLLVISGKDAKETAEIADRIRARCEKEMILPDGDNITVSAGVAEVARFENVEITATKLQDYLKESKAKGRNSVYSM